MNVKLATVYLVVWTVRVMGGAVHTLVRAKTGFSYAQEFAAELKSGDWCIHRVDCGPEGVMKQEVIESGPDYRGRVTRLNEDGTAWVSSVQTGPGLFDEEDGRRAVLEEQERAALRREIASERGQS